MVSAPPSESFDLPQSSMFLRIAALGTSDPLLSLSTALLRLKVANLLVIGDIQQTRGMPSNLV